MVMVYVYARITLMFLCLAAFEINIFIFFGDLGSPSAVARLQFRAISIVHQQNLDASLAATNDETR